MLLFRDLNSLLPAAINNVSIHYYLGKFKDSFILNPRVLLLGL
jgi:hypothetical protein